jgi:hypothetical protein
MKTETVGREFRVVAVTTTGGEALVCLAVTRRRAATKATLFARHGRLPLGTCRLRLEQWDAGRWVAVRTGRDELPVSRVRRPRAVAR